MSWDLRDLIETDVMELLNNLHQKFVNEQLSEGKTPEEVVELVSGKRDEIFKTFIEHLIDEGLIGTNGKQLYLTVDGKSFLKTSRFVLLTVDEIDFLLGEGTDIYHSPVNMNNFLARFVKHKSDFSKDMKLKNVFRRDIDKLPVEEMRMLIGYDDNFFNSLYTCLTSIRNIRGGDIRTRVYDSEKASDTLGNSLKLMFSDGCKLFHCSQIIGDMLHGTKNKIFWRPLPFPTMFVDVRFKPDVNTEIFGMFLSSVEDVGSGHVHTKNTASGSFMVLSMGADLRDMSIFFAYQIVDKNGLVQSESIRPVQKKISMFVCNFLDFLHDPSIKTVKANDASGRSHRALRNSYSSKVFDLNNIYLIKIEEPLKQYVDKMASLRVGREFSHKFDVRGHYRHLLSEFYKAKRGMKIWIPPFIKGKGLYLKKRYNIDKRDENVKMD